MPNSSYSFLIVPPEDVKQTLNAVIDTLAAKYGGPRFDAHLTLQGNISASEADIISGGKELAKRIRPFKITLTELSMSTTYFRNVFVRVEATTELMEANLAVKKLFRMENTVFMPHISLLYGKQHIEERERALSEVSLPKNLSFTAESIAIIPESSDPKDWTILETVHLGN